MEDVRQERKDFVGYEYKEIAGESSRISFLLDGYESFGWELDDRLTKSNEEHLGRSGKTILRLKRNRKIINKAELTRLQRNFEACINEIDKLEKEKTSAATMYALILAMIGTAFMAGSTFAVTAPTPQYILCIVLAVPGFLGWIFPYFLYKRITGKQTARVTSFIEEKYDEIYEICEKGNKLLY